MTKKIQSLGSIDGVRIGSAISSSGLSGTSVLLFPDGAVASAEVRGFATGTRQIDSLSLTHTVDRVFGLVISGGSVFGLESSSSVVEMLSREKIGLHTGKAYLPVVPTAVIYDLSFPENEGVDYRALGESALIDALSSGSADETPGAGAGASVGKILGIQHATKTSTGRAVKLLEEGYHVGAMVVLNAFGDVFDGQGRMIAGVRSPGGEGYVRTSELIKKGYTRKPFTGADSTTVTAVVTDGKLGRRELYILSAQVNNFLASLIRPYGSIFDGDIVFSFSTGKRKRVENILKFGAMAEEVVYESLVSAVFSAESSGGMPCAEEIVGRGGEIGRN